MQYTIARSDEVRIRTALFLDNGPAATSSSFPASGELTGSVDICSGTVVGPNAVLTAAHCVASDKKANISLKGKSVGLVCQRHPDYKQSGDCASPGDDACAADIALCKSENKIDLGASKYEVVQTNAAAIKKDMDIVMVGFGCTGDGKTDHGTLHMGHAKISRTSSETGKFPIDEMIITTGGAVTCFGDSGAGNFDVEDATKRFLIAVSKQRMQTGDGKPDKTHSVMVQVTDDRIVAFMKKWGDDNAAKICGVHGGVSGCR
jgi:V8-like Glu-specific endopeptidase